VGSVRGRGRLVGFRIVLVRRISLGMAFQFADVMTLAGQKENQGAGCEHEAGFAKE
jgi:hypothetical protein